MQDISELLEKSLTGLGYELVDFERSARGLLRVFIDKPEGINVDDCSLVSNHLSRLFLVENIDYDRLEISSPGLDRPLKKWTDFQRFTGCKVSIRLHRLVEGRKRFDAVIEAVNDGQIRLLLEPDDAGLNTQRKKAKLAKSVGSQAPKINLLVLFSDIERARLIPDI